MRLLTVSLLLLASVSVANAEPLTDSEIRNEAARLAKSAEQEPPTMALDILLGTATLIKPYAPQESQQIHQQAVRHGARYRSIAITYAVARLWMDLDPSQGELELRKFADQRRTLQALSSYYQGRNSPELTATRAAEALRVDAPPHVDNTSLIKTVAAQFPLRVPELLQLAHIRSDPGYGATFLAALEGLIRAAATQPDAVVQAAALLEPLLQRTDFDTSTKATLIGSLDLARRMADPALRTGAQGLARSRSVTHKDLGPHVPPVDANLPLTRAIEEVRKREPAYQQIGELWRYLQGKPRSAEEAKPILLELISWAEKADDPRTDPFWFLQSLLNLDGRLGPPGKAWQLPHELRPMLFLAAARVGQRMARQPDQLAALSMAMAKEKIDIPADIPSARNRVALDTFRLTLETRYDFSLPAADGTRVTLQSLRGKVVLLSFWATWCGICRAEMPILERLSKEFGEFGKNLEILAITDEPTERVTRFLADNPIALRILIDQPAATFRHYNVSGVPQSFLIEADGVLRQHFAGPVTEASLRAAISAAIEAKSVK